MVAAGLGGGVLAVVGGPSVFTAEGFPVGPIAGGIAAAWQSSIGNVAAVYTFAGLQSAGMAGVGGAGAGAGAAEGRACVGQQAAAP